MHLKGSGGRYHPGHGGLTPRVPLGGPEPAAGTSRCLLLESVAGVVTVPHGWGRGWAGLGRGRAGGRGGGSGCGVGSRVRTHLYSWRRLGRSSVLRK